jgi:hypothetical protein
MTDKQRVSLMLETAIDLTMQGYPLKKILTAFAVVRQFRALGSKSYPMCRALTSALVGQCLEPNTMSFEELLVHYRPSGDASLTASSTKCLAQGGFGRLGCLRFKLPQR